MCSFENDNKRRKCISNCKKKTYVDVFPFVIIAVIKKIH